MRSRQLGYEIEDSAKAFQAERDAFNEAVRTESNRIATELAPTHKAAVRRIATAIEELSRAVTAERAVREEFARLAPEQTSGCRRVWHLGLPRRSERHVEQLGAHRAQAWIFGGVK